MARQFAKTDTACRHPACSMWTPAAVITSVAALACAQIQKDEPPPPIASQQPPPPWAYPIQPPVTPPPDDGVPRRVPGSSVALTLTQIRDLYTPPDWHPSDHRAMPGIVGSGRNPGTFACGYCHYPNGQGRPENSSLAGLSARYIVQQMADFKNGLRKSSEPNMRPPSMMVDNAKNVTDEEAKISAEYFASLKYQPWIKVVEAETVPKTQVAGFMLVAIAGAEPIGQRIIEVAQDVARTSLRDSKSGFVAYVPLGSIKKGEALVATGGRGKTIACATCHGPGLKGAGDVPPLAGRSPSYIVRQLYDFQSGARAGALSAPMKDVVPKLTIEDMVSIAAYAASLSP
jgi:cytochrome c553